ncbi:hypothetical protein O181_037233 [Austropuccinia psidii MF-1]|uniref:Uncharacterized protein n=1 Tax=Austropuccinia psidii MF-1 TaxID=1389203 RepID=A0A9Q3DB08_9BASI|nr:hypothetical protein [Austropuccinia psidii MF-1]
MELIDYMDGILIDVPSIPDYWITARLNTAFKGHANIWYTEMKGIYGRRNWPWWKSKIIQKASNGTWICQKTMSFENDKYSVDRLNTEYKGHASICYTEMNEIHGGRVKSSKSTAMKKFYASEQVPEEESPTEDSESDSMGDSIREQSDEDQYLREEFLVEYQEETPLKTKDIQLESGVPQDTANKNLCKHTQYAQTFIVTPTQEMAYIHGTATRMTVCIDNSRNPLIIDSGAHF